MKPVGRLRSLLFAPAVRPDFIEKLAGRGADAVVIDCEDATPANAKAEARANAAQLAAGVAAGGPQVTVRVNAEPTEWFRADVTDALTDALTAVVVPKIETVGAIDRVAAALDAAGFDDLGVIAGIETALGVADARALLAHDRVLAGYFGAEDFIADMGGVRTESNHEVGFARQSVALAGRLAGVPVLDQIVADIRNHERFTREAEDARAMGFAGKLCIHPAQVALANDAFVPSADEIERAQRLLAAYQSATTEGIAAIDFEGQMVDEPLAAQARRILDLAG